MRNPFARNRKAGIDLHIGLATDGIALLKRAGRHGPLSVAAERKVTAEQSSTIELLVLQLMRMLEESDSSGHSTHIVIDDRLTRLFMVTPPQNTTSLRDCRAAAAMRFQELYGEPPGQWQIDADWDARQPFLACALPAALPPLLEQAAQEHGLKLLSVAPQFIAAWNRWHAQLDGAAWFGLAHGDQLSLGVVDNRRLRAVRHMPVAEGAWQDAQNTRWLSELLQREALRLSLAPPNSLQLCGATGAHLPAPCSRLDEAQSATPASLHARLAASGMAA